jgi:uncharacterized ferritin-like protein (DUF455 family)
MDFRPFEICQPGEWPDKPRPMNTPEGVGDRMRSAAFAELQASAAFKWAAEHFQEAPAELRASWTDQVADESRHYGMIRRRMDELGVGVTEKKVSLSLWEALQNCTTGEEFCVMIAAAEEKGRRAGLKLAGHMKNADPETARIFLEIAEDEVAHVALAETHFNWTPE